MVNIIIKMLSRIPRTTSRLGLRFQSTQTTKNLDRSKLPRLAAIGTKILDRFMLPSMVAISASVPLYVAGKLVYVGVTHGVPAFVVGTVAVTFAVLGPVCAAISVSEIFHEIRDCIHDCESGIFEIFWRPATCVAGVFYLLFMMTMSLVIGVVCAGIAYNILFMDPTDFFSVDNINN